MKRKIFIMLLFGFLVIAALYSVNQLSSTITIGDYEAKSHIDVTLDFLKISLASSPDDQIHIQLQGSKLNNDSIAISVENDTLVMTEQQSKKKWYEILPFRSTPTVIVQLPTPQMKALTLNTTDGDCTLQDLTLDTIQVETAAGFLDVNNIVASNAQLRTQDGPVKMNKNVIDHLSLTTSAGDITIRESMGSNHAIQTTDG